MQSETIEQLQLQKCFLIPTYQTIIHSRSENMQSPSALLDHLACLPPTNLQVASFLFFFLSSTWIASFHTQQQQQRLFIRSPPRLVRPINKHQFPFSLIDYSTLSTPLLPFTTWPPFLPIFHPGPKYPFHLFHCRTKQPRNAFKYVRAINYLFDFPFSLQMNPMDYPFYPSPPCPQARSSPSESRYSSSSSSQSADGTRRPGRRWAAMGNTTSNKWVSSQLQSHEDKKLIPSSLQAWTRQWRLRWTWAQVDNNDSWWRTLWSRAPRSNRTFLVHKRTRPAAQFRLRILYSALQPQFDQTVCCWIRLAITT